MHDVVSARRPSASCRSLLVVACARLTMRDMLNAGADKISLNTAAVVNPDLIGQSAAKWQPMHCRRHRRQACRCKQMGSLHPRWTQTDRLGCDRRARKVVAGAGEILLTSMDRDAPKTAMISASPARSAMRSKYPSSPPASWYPRPLCRCRGRRQGQCRACSIHISLWHLRRQAKSICKRAASRSGYRSAPRRLTCRTARSLTAILTATRRS